MIPEISLVFFFVFSSKIPSEILTRIWQEISPKIFLEFSWNASKVPPEIYAGIRQDISSWFFQYFLHGLLPFFSVFFSGFFFMNIPGNLQLVYTLLWRFSWKKKQQGISSRIFFSFVYWRIFSRNFLKLLHKFFRSFSKRFWERFQTISDIIFEISSIIFLGWLQKYRRRFLMGFNRRFSSKFLYGYFSNFCMDLSGISSVTFAPGNLSIF